jgi:hypothetical protein
MSVHQRRLHRAAKRNGLAIKLNSKGPSRDNVFIGRILKFIRYEGYPRAYASASQARTPIEKRITVYYSLCSYSCLKELTSDQVCINRLPESMSA